MAGGSFCAGDGAELCWGLGRRGVRRAWGLVSKCHRGNTRNQTLIFQAWHEERDQSAVPQLGVQAVLEARVASLDKHEWRRALPCDSTHRSGLTTKGAKCPVAEAGAHPDPRGIQAAVCEQNTANITLRGSGHPAKNPLLYKSQHMIREWKEPPLPQQVISGLAELLSS